MAGPPSYAKVGAVANVGGKTNTQFTASTTGTSATVVLTKTAGPNVSIGDVISARGLPAGTTLLSQSSGSPGDSGTYVMSNPGNFSSLPVVVNAKVTAWQSVGRGMEATVAEGVCKPPGGTDPVMAVQDLGAPMIGDRSLQSGAKYPDDMYSQFTEYTCESVEFGAADPSLMAARVTDQGADFADVSGYSTNRGARGSWTQFAGTPTALWQAHITATISGTTLTVTAINPGEIIFPYAQIATNSVGGGTNYGRVQPYGTGGTSGAGGLGTYILSDGGTVASPTALFSVTPIQGGQTVAIDIDSYMTCPAGLNSITVGQWVIPAYTNDRGATWQRCSPRS